MQITELDAGQDLDVLVAEQVLHWRIVDTAPFAASYDAATNVLTYGRWAIPGLSTNLLDTWLIVEHIGPQYLDWLTYRGDRYYAKIKGHIGEGRTPSLAICRAALAAVGVGTPAQSGLDDPPMRREG